jgi:hypothetical protein
MREQNRYSGLTDSQIEVLDFLADCEEFDLDDRSDVPLRDVLKCGHVEDDVQELYQRELIGFSLLPPVGEGVLVSPSYKYVRDRYAPNELGVYLCD